MKILILQAFPGFFKILPWQIKNIFIITLKLPYFLYLVAMLRTATVFIVPDSSNLKLINQIPLCKQRDIWPLRHSPYARAGTALGSLTAGINRQTHKLDKFIRFYSKSSSRSTSNTSPCIFPISYPRNTALANTPRIQ